MDTKNWDAWINVMPGQPAKLHVTGEVYGSNPGIEPRLSVKKPQPQGSNPSTLFLELNVTQKPGEWMAQVVWLKVKYEEVLDPVRTKYTQVEIFEKNSQIANISVKEVQ